MRALKPAPEAEFKAVCDELAQTRHPHSGRVGLVVSLSAPQRCTEDFLMRWRGFADTHGLPLVMHVQETRMQVVTGGLFYGQPMVEYLQRIGFLKPNTSLIHAVWLNPREIEALARAGTTAQVKEIQAKYPGRFVWAAGADITNAGLDLITGTATDLEIVLATDGATLSGQLTDSANQPVNSGTISLQRTNATRPVLELYSYQATVTSTGQFTIPAIAPGEYHLIYRANGPAQRLETITLAPRAQLNRKLQLR